MTDQGGQSVVAGTGIYVHVPFCLKRCDYCDFTTFAGRDESIPGYMAALRTHIERTFEERTPTALSTLFIGGGTPTYIPPTEMAALLATLRQLEGWAGDAEWTVEANPETVTPEMASVLADGGINRVSLGAQSFDTRVLGVLGRWHDIASVERAVRLLRGAGIDRLSLDLIYGTPGETDQSWRRSLAAAVDLQVTHVSAYALTVEPNTPYAARSRTEPALLPDDDVQARRMEIAEQMLTAAGLRRYEVSNWAAAGHESRHNLMYWRGEEWLAFGCGAHGHVDGRRYWLVRDPDRYAAMVEDGQEPLGGEEHPDAAEQRLERLMMGLRLVEGVPIADLEPLDAGAVARLQTGGLVAVESGRLRVTEAGRPLTGSVIAALA